MKMTKIQFKVKMSNGAENVAWDWQINSYSN